MISKLPLNCAGNGNGVGRTLRITRCRGASSMKKPEFEKPGLAHQLLDACGLVFIIHLSGFSLCEKAFVSYLQDFFD